MQRLRFWFRYVLAVGLKILMSKSVICPFTQNPCTAPSTLASLVLTDDVDSVSAVKGCSIGLIDTYLQNSAVRW